MPIDLPNILYLHSHDTGRYIQPYGYAVPTPRLQQLAEEGTLFRHAFCVSPTCSASRAAMLTGQCSHTNGMMGLSNRGFKLHDPKRHLAWTLREHGYHCALMGFHHIAPNDPLSLGWHEHPETAGSFARELVPAAVDWIRRQAGGGQPFFAAVGFSETHRTGNWGHTHQRHPDEPKTLLGDPRYSRPPAGFPDHATCRADWADFCVAAQWLDEGIGAVLDALE